ncbi:hypothetical protein COMNV_00205 [Commensalibacter sp. Nvir]|uniref:hypothetical protein n=1 Tax=Commensalibacter sp. Nvir TaxID=3069817 RepID=UPI002D220600|nr:hypothetical protein COMNV_00205 [Commensalibacter sp. Nvir]
MMLSFFLGLLLLITISGFLNTTLHAVSHTVLTMLCIIFGKTDVLSNEITVILLCSLALFGSCFGLLLRGYRIERSFKEFVGVLIFTVISIMLTAQFFSSSLSSFEYAVSSSIIWIGFVYNMLSRSYIAQLLGIFFSLNALCLISSLWGNTTNIAVTLFLYIPFLCATLILSIKTERFMRNKHG